MPDKDPKSTDTASQTEGKNVQLEAWKQEFGEDKVWIFELTDERGDGPDDVIEIVVRKPKFAETKLFLSELALGGAKMVNAIVGLLKTIMLEPSFKEFYARVDDAVGPGDRPGWLMALSGEIQKELGFTAKAIRKN